MDFKQLQSFVAVVECASFTKAAQQLFVSQPTISAHVRALEEELRSSLIIRTTKRIEVTENGKRVYEDALSILRIKERMAMHCSAENHRILHVAASTIPAAYMLPGILAEYGRLSPQTYFNIQRMEGKRVLDSVLHGSVDLGFATMHGGEKLMSLPVCRDRMVLITPVTEFYMRQQAQPVLNLEQLLSQPIILRENSESGKKQADRYLQDLGIKENNLSIVARVNDQETVKSLVAGGMGGSLISYMAASDYIKEKRVLCFELPVRQEKTIYLVCRKADAQLEHICSFTDFVENRLCKKD